MMVATILRMSQAFAINGGRSMSATKVGHRDLWLGLSTSKNSYSTYPYQLTFFGPDIQLAVHCMEMAKKASEHMGPHLCPQQPSPHQRQ